MLDIKHVRRDPQGIIEALKKKRFDFPLDKFVRLDSQRKEADVRSQELLAERKKASKQIGALIAQGKSVDDAKAEVNETLERLSTELDAAVEEAKTVQQALDELLMGTPNLPDAAVPEGVDEEDNEQVLVWGTPREMSFEAKDHAAIAIVISLKGKGERRVAQSRCRRMDTISCTSSTRLVTKEAIISVMICANFTKHRSRIERLNSEE